MAGSTTLERLPEQLKGFLGAADLFFYDPEVSLPSDPNLMCLCLLADGAMTVGVWDTRWRCRGWLLNNGDVVAWAQLLRNVTGFRDRGRWRPPVQEKIRSLSSPDPPAEPDPSG